jgi:hypothetical protein
MGDGGEKMNSNSDQHVTPSTHRTRRITSSLTDALGMFAVVAGVVCLLVLSFVGSRSAASSTVRSALDSADVRRAIAEELVNKLEEGGDNGQKIVIHAAHSKVVDAVEASLSESKLRDTAANAAGTIYGVYVEGKPPATVALQIFADAAFKAIELADPSIPPGASPRLDPLDIARSDGSPDLASIRSLIRLVPWMVLAGGVILLAISWFLSSAPRWRKMRRLGIRIFVNGAVLIVVAYAMRSISIGDDSSSRIAEALVSFATGRLIMWSIVVAVVGAVVALVGGIMNRRVTSKHTASV